MNDERDTLHDDEDASLGAPVTELAALVAPPPEGAGAGRLLSRVRARINRRQLTASTLDVTLMGMFRTFFEFLSLFIQALAGGGDRDRER